MCVSIHACLYVRLHVYSRGRGLVRGEGGRDKLWLAAYSRIITIYFLCVFFVDICIVHVHVHVVVCALYMSWMRVCLYGLPGRREEEAGNVATMQSGRGRRRERGTRKGTKAMRAPEGLGQPVPGTGRWRLLKGPAEEVETPHTLGGRVRTALG